MKSLQIRGIFSFAMYTSQYLSIASPKTESACSLSQFLYMPPSSFLVFVSFLLSLTVLLAEFRSWKCLKEMSSKAVVFLADTEGNSNSDFDSCHGFCCFPQVVLLSKLFLSQDFPESVLQIFGLYNPQKLDALSVGHKTYDSDSLKVFT